jgi:hypothetical protein
MELDCVLSWIMNVLNVWKWETLIFLVIVCKSNFCEVTLKGKVFWSALCLQFRVMKDCICVYQSAAKAVEKAFSTMKGMCTKQVFIYY